MKHVFIINPAAGKGLAESGVLPELYKVMKESGLDYDLHRSLSKNDIASYVKQRAKTGEPVRFYACGGDGTINDVLSGMMGFDNAQLACIPCGSGNDFVRNFSEKSNFLDIHRQLNGTPVPVDVIRFNDSYCLNMLNIGTDCDIVAESLKLRSSGISGSASYLTAALRVLAKGGTYRMKYMDEKGEEKTEELLLIAVANGRFCGGGFKSCPRASLNDGLMDIGIVRPVRGLKLFPLLLKYRNGTHLESKAAEKYVTYMQLSSFTLIPGDTFNVSVDGEIEPFVETQFSVVRNGVNFVVPEGSALL